MIDFKRHSPSSLQLFAASPALFVLEKLLGIRQPGNAPMHRGTAVEDGVTHGLMNPTADVQEAIEVALKKYDTITALSSDKRREEYRETISDMVKSALKELRPYGVPSQCQGFIEWKPDGLRYPVVGFFDYHFSDINLTVDLKTTERLPSSVKIPHARQVALYVSSNNADARITYCTPKKCVTYQVENIDEHRKQLHQMALNCEAWLAQSDDPQYFLKTTVPDVDSFYWSQPPMRALAYEYWRI
jgi:hypothetical protein